MPVRFRELKDKEIYVIIIITFLYQARIISRGIRFLIFDCI